MLGRATQKLSVLAFGSALVLSAQVVRKTISGAQVNALETPTGSRLQWGKEITTKVYRADDPYVIRKIAIAESKPSPSEEDAALMICVTFEPTCSVTITSAYQIDFESDFASTSAHPIAGRSRFESEIIHPDGSTTKISHQSGNHIVERSNGGADGRRQRTASC